MNSSRRAARDRNGGAGGRGSTQARKRWARCIAMLCHGGHHIATNCATCPPRGPPSPTDGRREMGSTGQFCSWAHLRFDPPFPSLSIQRRRRGLGLAASQCMRPAHPAQIRRNDLFFCFFGFAGARPSQPGRRYGFRVVIDSPARSTGPVRGRFWEHWPPFRSPPPLRAPPSSTRSTVHMSGRETGGTGKPHQAHPCRATQWARPAEASSRQDDSGSSGTAQRCRPSVLRRACRTAANNRTDCLCLCQCLCRCRRGRRNK